MKITLKMLIPAVIGISIISIVFVAALVIKNNEIELVIDYDVEKPYTEMALSFSTDIFVISDVESMMKDVNDKLHITFKPDIEYTIKPLDARSCIVELYNPQPANEYHFTITVKGYDKKAITITCNNKEIEQEKDYYFRTPLLKVVEYRRTSQMINTPIVLQFNFPVSLEVLKQKLSIDPKINVAVDYDKDDTTKKTVVVNPVNEKKAQKYTLTIDKGMVPVGGVLGMDSHFSFTYNTFYPLELMKVESTYGRSGSLYPDYPVEFTFNNEIAIPEGHSVGEYVTVSPNPGGVQVSVYGDTVSISGNFIGKERYTVTIAKNIQDIYGQTLDESIVEEITFEHAFSHFSCPESYMLVESYMEKIIPMHMVNVSSFSCKYCSLADEKDIRKYLENPKKYFNEFATVKHYTVNWSWDVYKTVKFDFSKLHAFNHGFFVYEITPSMENPYNSGSNTFHGVMKFSDIGVTVKKTKHNVFVHVRSLLHNTPLQNAFVYCTGDSPVGKTDKKGVVIVKNTGCTLYAIKHEQSVFYYSMGNSSYYDEDHSNSAIPLPEKYYGSSYSIDKPQMHLFTDRYLYKPGEIVHVKGIFRYRNNDRWSLYPPLSPVKDIVVTVYNSRDEEIESYTKTLSQTGGVQWEIPIKGNYPTGYYRIDVTTKNKDYTFDNSITFQVEEFKPAKAEMKIIPGKLQYHWGEMLAMDVFGWYLFGAPVNNDVEYTVSLTPIVYRSETYPDYSFSTQLYYYDEYDEYNPSATTIATGKAKVNEKGIAKVFVPLKAMVNVPNADIVITAKTYLSDDSPVFGAKAGLQVFEPVHVGIRVPRYFNNTASPVTVQMVALNSSDKVVEGNTVKLVVKKHEWKSFQIAGVNGRLQWEYKNIATDVYAQNYVIGKKEVTVAINNPGYYTAEVYDSSGKRKFAVESFYSIGNGEAGWRVNDDESVDVETDKSSYNVGDTAMLLVKNPFEKASAMVTVEREKFFDYFEVPATTSIVMIPVKITEEHIPNIYVSVMLYTPRTGFNNVKNGEDLAKPKCYIGYANIKVVPREKKLQVKVKSDKKQYKPGEETTIEINVTNFKGQPINGEATISVADRGVLNLVNYTLPNPLNFFYAPRSLAVTTFDVRQIILGQRYIKEKGELIGGDGGIASMGMIVPRADIRFSAYYNATVKVEKGVARIKFKLPDNLTSFKSMVVVHTNDSRFGYGETTFEVKTPLMVLPTFPRFARVGDAFDAGALVFNYSGTKQKITVSMELSGGMKCKDGKLSSIKEIDLNNGQSTELTFPIVVDNVNTSTFVIKAKAGKYTDGIKDSITIKAPNIYETVAQYGRITKREESAKHTIDISHNIIPYVSAINVFVSPSAFSELKGSLDYLVEYPYGCLEQKASRILPLILGEDIIIQRNLLKIKSKEDLKNTVATILKEFPGYFKNDGFSYWQDSSYTSSYLTVYATFIMTMAKKHGYTVDAVTFDKALATVKRFAAKGAIFSNEESFFSNYYKYLTLSFAHYVAALNGVTSENQLKLVYSVMNSKYTDMIAGYAYLLKAVALYPDSNFKQSMTKMIAQKFFSAMRTESGYVYFKDVSDWGYFYYDDVIATSLILQSLLETGVPFDNDYKVVNYLLKQRKGYAWLNTHENAVVWWALNTYFKKYEKEKPDFAVKVLFNARELLNALITDTSTTYSGLHAITPQDIGSRSLQLSKKGGGILYYTFRYNYIPVYDKMTSKNMGFLITKRFKDVKTGNEVTAFKKGAEYLVEIEVYTPKERGITVLDDQLPAGFEPVNITFANEEKMTMEKRNGYYADWGTFNHYEQYNDRVVYYADFMHTGNHTVVYKVRATNSGIFKLPACKVEEMYNPEVFGIMYYTNAVQVQ